VTASIFGGRKSRAKRKIAIFEITARAENATRENNLAGLGCSLRGTAHSEKPEDPAIPAQRLGSATLRGDATQSRSKKTGLLRRSLLAMTAAAPHNGPGAYSQCVNAIDAR
jgi:hypothetical protein